VHGQDPCTTAQREEKKNWADVQGVSSRTPGRREHPRGDARRTGARGELPGRRRVTGGGFICIQSGRRTKGDSSLFENAVEHESRYGLRTEEDNFIRLQRSGRLCRKRWGGSVVLGGDSGRSTHLVFLTSPDSKILRSCWKLRLPCSKAYPEAGRTTC